VGEKVEMSSEESPIECVFCGKPRIKRGKIVWRSSIRIETDYVIKDKILSVCPDCRKKHSIQDLYDKTIELLIEAAKEVIEDLEEEEEPKGHHSPLW
jgi:hypothetical protein